MCETGDCYMSTFLCLFAFLPPSDLGQAIFYTTTCLLPFLSDDILSTLPYTMISTLATFPPFLHKDIIEYLSTSFLPMAIREYVGVWSHCGSDTEGKRRFRRNKHSLLFLSFISFPVHKSTSTLYAQCILTLSLLI